MAESEELKSLLLKVKEESEKVVLKLNIQKTKIMASGPIISWQIDGKQWKQWETLFWGARVAQMVKHLSIMWETRVWSLGWEDPLEKEMTIHSSILAWKIPWTEEPSGLLFIGSQRIGRDWAANTSLHIDGQIIQAKDL